MVDFVIVDDGAALLEAVEVEALLEVVAAVLG